MNDRHNQNGAASSRDEERRALLTAYALGQLEGEELQQFDAELRSAEGTALRNEAEHIRRLAGEVKAASAGSGDGAASPELRSAVLRCLDSGKPGPAASADDGKVEVAKRLPSRRSRWLSVAIVGGVLSLLVAVLAIPGVQNRLAGRSETADRYKIRGAVEMLDETASVSTPLPTSAPAAATPDPDGYGNMQPANRPAILSASAGHDYYDERGETETAGAVPGLRPASPAPTSGEPLVVDYSSPYGPSTAAAPVQLGLDVRAQSEAKTLTDSLSTVADPKPVARVAAGGVAGAYGTVPRQREALAQLQKGIKEGEIAGKGREHYARNFRLHDSDHDGTTQLYSLAPSNEQYDPIVENAFLSPQVSIRRPLFLQVTARSN